MADKKSKTWGGRFSEPTDAFVQAFTASVSFDQRLASVDIQASIAHVKMLAKVGVLAEQEAEKISEGLQSIATEIEQDSFPWKLALEDVHMNIEARLVEKIGELGKKLHTGRSRNDQVATDMRLFLRQESDALMQQLRQLQTVLLEIADRETATVMPGFTHLQVAQPVSFAHHMMAWFSMLDRDKQRLQDGRKRINVLPLGAAALAGTGYPLDREYTATLLGFDRPSENSLDAVSDRDFVVEFCSNCALLMAHLSRFSEELVLWSSAQFNFIELPDRFCTGSSIMPQKKNPDVPELVRGKTGRVYGNLMGLLTLLKSQPLAYNKDNQEDKEALFDSLDTAKHCLRAYIDMLPHMNIHRDQLRAAARLGYATATDLADYLVKKGLAFRDAHEVVGRCVQLAIQKNCQLDELSIEEFQSFSPLIEKDVLSTLSLDGALMARNIFGGTAPDRVKQAIQSARQRLDEELNSFHT